MFMIKSMVMILIVMVMMKFMEVIVIFMIISQPIYRVIVCLFFLLSFESLNYCPGNSFGYLLGLYYGLVLLFAVNIMKVLINMRNDDEQTICFKPGKVMSLLPASL